MLPACWYFGSGCSPHHFTPHLLPFPSSVVTRPKKFVPAIAGPFVILAFLLPYFLISLLPSYAVAVFACCSATATSFRSGTTGMSWFLNHAAFPALLTKSMDRPVILLSARYT